MLECMTRREILAALREDGVAPDADLDTIAAAVRRHGFELSLAASGRVVVEGRRAVLRRATVGRDGTPVAVAYSSNSARAAAFEALGRALICECWPAWRSEGADDTEGGPSPN